MAYWRKLLFGCQTGNMQREVGQFVVGNLDSQPQLQQALDMQRRLERWSSAAAGHPIVCPHEREQKSSGGA